MHPNPESGGEFVVFVDFDLLKASDTWTPKTFDGSLFS